MMNYGQNEFYPLPGQGNRVTWPPIQVTPVLPMAILLLAPGSAL